MLSSDLAALSRSLTLFAWAGLLLASLIPSWGSFRDDFDDGNDEGWTRFDPLGTIGVADPVEFLFEDGGYRFRAPVPAADAAGPARAFSYLEGEEYEDFFCSVDILDWNDGINQAFGILGRAQSVALGETTGYVCNYNPNQTGGQPGGQFQINRVTGEAEDGTIAAADMKLVAGRGYRIVFFGEEDRLTGMMFDLEDLSSPLVTIATDGMQDERATTYPSGAVGLFNFYRGGDALEAHAVADTRFDNFWVEVSNPYPELLPGVAPFAETALHLHTVSPLATASFHPPHQGIMFEVGSNDGSSVESSQFSFGSDGDEVFDPAYMQVVEAGGELAFHYGGLRPNAIYRPSAELSSGQGRSVSYTWQFDTIDPIQMHSNAFIVIEAEDYNYDGGEFQDFPPPSGLGSTGTPVDTEGEGYYEKAGVLGVDYLDTDETPQESNDYRPDDPVGLRAGSDQVEPGPIIPDAPRQKYRESGARDYQLYRTEAGEWTNYTRTFPAGEYAVYLRAASRWEHAVRLDRVTSDASAPNQVTEALGRFAVPNTVVPQRFEHVPLVADNGDPVTIELEGETTLRLTMDGLAEDFALRRVLYVNYLLFVPISSDEPNLEVGRGNVFGDLGSQAREVTVSLPVYNSATNEALAISGAEVRGENAALYRVDDFTASIEPGQLGHVTVTLSPNGQEGVFLAELVLQSNDASDPEITVDLSARVAVASELLVHYPFDETEGTEVLDISGNRRHGTYGSTGGGGVILGEDGLAPGTGTAVRLLDVDGGAGFIEIPAQSGLPPLDAFTAAIWLDASPDEAQGTLFSKGTEPADPFAVAVAGARLAWGADSEQVFQTDEILTPGSAQHLALTYSVNGENGEVSVYIDGALAMTDASGGVFDDDALSIFQVGALNGDIGLQGVVDDFQLYGRALSADEIAFLHANPGSPVGGSPDPMPSDLVITELAIDGADVVITFTSVPGQEYALEANGGLQSGDWAVLMNPVGAEAPAIETTVRVPVAGFASRYFRMR